MKSLLLERKLSTLADSLEKKEAQLNEVLAASNLDPNALGIVNRKLEEMLDAKNNAIKDMQYELARMCKTHADTVATYAARLEEYGVPRDNIGFEPLRPCQGKKLGRGPAGLVSGGHNK
ncbi:Dynein regulatory complex subunit 4 [Amphibalanus amphitrite]|uniref:Dynein regulatory complex subunit 4 n=2 Tax=Amphibalanus amphitrite TaxID=1232801 RepID=A0A6A4W9C1_AMPAM|nr:Dynein regulatory complex subunit 4 [Amphibalanus amphitrite]